MLIMKKVKMRTTSRNHFNNRDLRLIWNNHVIFIHTWAVCNLIKDWFRRDITKIGLISIQSNIHVPAVMRVFANQRKFPLKPISSFSLVPEAKGWFVSQGYKQFHRMMASLSATRLRVECSIIDHLLNGF